jgi:hypothetical protein
LRGPQQHGLGENRALAEAGQPQLLGIAGAVVDPPLDGIHRGGQRCGRLTAGRARLEPAVAAARRAQRSAQRRNRRFGRQQRRQRERRVLVAAVVVQQQDQRAARVLT